MIIESQSFNSWICGVYTKKLLNRRRWLTHGNLFTYRVGMTTFV